MTSEELGKLYPIELKKYSSQWTTMFKKEKEILKALLGSDLRIEHIGSTAIKNLLAKPTVDILLEFPHGFTKADLIKVMEENGYIYMKEQRKHLMFVKGYTLSGLEKESYHIHIGPLTQSWLWDRVYFRDYLRKNHQEAQKYEKLKTELSEKYKFDRDAYTDKKSEYVQRITNIAKKEFKNTLY